MSIPKPPSPPAPPPESRRSQQLGPSTAGGNERWSILAILSSVVLVVPLIGPLVAMFLGALALIRLRRIELAGGVRMRGRRLATIGLGAGAALLLIESYIFDAVVTSFSDRIDRQATDAIANVFEVQDAKLADAALTTWSSHRQDRVSRDDVLSFSMECRSRFGAFQSMSILARDSPGFSLSRQAVSAAVAYRFERGEYIGAMVMLLEPDPLSPFQPRPRLAEITLDDRDKGTLRLGPAQLVVPPAPTPGPAPDSAIEPETSLKEGVSAS